MGLVNTKYSTREIIKDLTHYIKVNELPEGTALAPTTKMALRYNVSQSTINRAVSKLVASGLICRIPGSGTYVAQSPSLEKKAKIAILGWQRNQDNPLDKAAYNTFEDTVVQQLEKANCDVTFIWRAPYMSNTFDSNQLAKYDLLIIPEGMLNDDVAFFLSRLKIKVIVILGDKLSPYPFHQVFHDYRLGFMKALELIKNKGFDHICIASTSGDTSAFRTKILKECAKKENITYREIPHEELMHNETAIVVLRGREKAKYFVENNWKGVIFSTSDFLTFGMLDYFREKNIEVGKDVFIVSYDNIEGRGVLVGKEPVLTSITHPLLELANKTVSLTIKLLKSQDNDNFSNHIIRVQSNELVIRKSLN